MRERPRPFFNVLSALAPIPAAGCAVLAFYLTDYFFHPHPARSAGIAIIPLWALLLFGFASACVALVRRERLWGVTALGMVLNSAPIFLALWNLTF